jgi:hypothetical protein
MKHTELLKTPVLFIIYDRADTALKVFNAIKQVQPENLFIASDGPACRYDGESDNVLNLRDSILKKINWQCNVSTFFGEQNHGPRKWISSAISWFFENVDYGIILEHDCLPDKSFFYYCTELLNKYKSEKRIMHISGANFLYKKVIPKSSYYFSKYAFIWGWATWKRAWTKYDVDMTGWDDFYRKGRLKKILNSKLEQDFWAKVFERAKNGRFNSWDYQWFFTIWNNNGLSINSSSNLISNIGYDEKALNTYYDNCILSNVKRNRIQKIVHPRSLTIDEIADRISFEYYFGEHINVLFEQSDLLNDECEKRLKLINELNDIAKERLDVINVLDNEVKRLKSI